MAARILVVEDDDAIRETTRWLLEDEGYAVEEAASAEDALDLLQRKAIDCVLVDLMLPGMDGFDCCRAIRSGGGTPIIMLTARTDKFDVVAGLEAGADDYVTKPFAAKELTARIRALLRRRSPSTGNRPSVRAGDVEILVEDGTVRRDGVDIALTATEFKLVAELAAAPGRLFTREVLLGSVWGYPCTGDTKLVDAHVHRLRSKLERDPSRPQVVLTVRGLGYKLGT